MRSCESTQKREDETNVREYFDFKKLSVSLIAHFIIKGILGKKIKFITTTHLEVLAKFFKIFENWYNIKIAIKKVEYPTQTSNTSFTPKVLPD